MGKIWYLMFVLTRRRHAAGHWVEQTFWMVGCGLLVTAGIFLSVKLVEKWASKPMFVSFDTLPTQIWDVPFPAVTVCNVHEANIEMVSNLSHSFFKSRTFPISFWV